MDSRLDRLEGEIERLRSQGDADRELVRRRERELHELRQSQSRWLRATTVLIVVGGLGVWAYATAAPGDPVPNSFSNGGVIQAQDMNANFDALVGQTSELQGRVVKESGAESTSVAGAYCGATVATDGQFTSATNTGVRAARDLCAATCSSPTAHMCTQHEASISAQLGTIPAGEHWISTMYSANGSELVVDCSNFTSNFASLFGVIANGALSADRRPCSDSYPIMCCD